MNDPDRAVDWPAESWPSDVDGGMPDHLWASDGFIPDEQPAAPAWTGSLVSLAFITEAVRRKRRWWCTAAVLGLLVGTALYVRYPPAYHAQVTVLLVDSPNQDPVVEVQTDLNLAQSQPVAARVVKQLGLHQSVASLQAAYSISALSDTVLLFNVGAKTSAGAVQRAAAVATAFLHYRSDYAQTLEAQLLTQLDAQYKAAEKRLQAVDAKIGQLPTTNLTKTQAAQLDNLETQLGDAKQAMQYVTGTKSTSQTATSAMVTGSYVLNPAALVGHSRLKGAALNVAGGLFGGLMVGLGIVIVSALLSDRLRRRDDVAAVLGSPVRLSVGSLRAPGRLRLPSRRRRAKRDRDMRRVSSYLQGAIPGSPKGPASLAVVVVDDAQSVAPAIASLARSRAQEGKQVVVADLCGGAPLARLLGAGKPGVHEVSRDGVRLTVAVPAQDDIAPVGPLRCGGSLGVWARPDEALVTACSSADLLLTLVKLDPALGGDHLATWACDAVAVVTAGCSSAERIRGAAEMIRLAGTRLDSAILTDADRNDESLGTIDPVHPSAGSGLGEPGRPERGDDGMPVGRSLSD